MVPVNLVLSNVTDIMLLFLAIENLSIFSYLVCLESARHGGVEAAVRYFTYGVFGTICLLWGVLD